MFVLGIDPGLTRCGYGALERSGVASPAFRAVLAGVIGTPVAMPVEERLGQMATEIDALLDEVRPSTVAVERVFFQHNAHSAISVAQVSGIAVALAARRGIEVVQFTPSEVKMAVVGNGAATKHQVQAMVVHLCGLDRVPDPPDVADAMALAACQLTSGRLRGAVRAAQR